ncbi:MAG TPA: HlyD family efflux transporter periplasmic adaptor subunit [Chitinophagaceae bacterium]
MPQTLFPSAVVDHTIESYLPRVTVKSQLIYTTAILVFLIGLALLPFIYINVSIQCPGIVRPVVERTELRTLIAGTIEQVTGSDGQQVAEGQELVRLSAAVTDNRLKLNDARQKEREREIADLCAFMQLDKEQYDTLTNASLRSALYRQQYSRFIFRLTGYIATREKLGQDLHVKQQLYDNGKVISLQELENQRYEYNAAAAAFNAEFEQQLSIWQQELTNNRIALTQLLSEQHQLQQEKKLTIIRAPVAGSLQQFRGIYKGNYIQAGEVLGIVSPDSGLVMECYVKPADIGLLREGMKANFQIDAFNYNAWGMLNGEITAIGSDFLIVDSQPVFLVRCTLNATSLHLKNGYKGNLKKGMTARARFIIARRNLYRLLYDKADNWLNPQTTTYPL